MLAFKRRACQQTGALLVEAIIASFLMLFAFAVAASLFDASLSWEAGSSNARRAIFVAQKKMEELRASSAKISSGSSFLSTLNSLMVTNVEYSEAPGFKITTTILKNSHKPVHSSGNLPTDGLHSPCTSFFTTIPTVAKNLPDGNPQYNNTYATYPYSRHLNESAALVQVTVAYGANEHVALISLLTDPIALTPIPPKKAKIVITRTSGSAMLANGTDVSLYSAQLITAGGATVANPTILWTVALGSSGSLRLLPKDSSGSAVEVRRRIDVTPPGAGANAKIQALIRFGGWELTGLSEDISLP